MAKDHDDALRRRNETKSRLLAVRLPPSLVAAIDEHVETMRIESPWVSITRSDAVRWLLTVALEQELDRLSGGDRMPRSEGTAGEGRGVG